MYCLHITSIYTVVRIVVVGEKSNGEIDGANDLAGVRLHLKLMQMYLVNAQVG